MISVIIPTYNRSAFLKEALDSVLAQSDAELEIIVIDDGSTDNTALLVKRYIPPVRYIYQLRRGVSSARNQGIRAARGEWLAFLDSDDLWLPGKIAAQLRYISSNPDIRICQTEEIWMYNGKRIYPKKYHRKPEGYAFSRLLQRCLISPSAVMIHQSVFEKVGLFDESLPACEDYDLWLRIGFRYPIGRISEALVIKRGGHPDQLSSSIPALDKYRIKALINLLRNEPLNPLQRKQVLIELERKCRIYGEGCKKRGRMEEAEMILKIPALCASEAKLFPEGRGKTTNPFAHQRLEPAEIYRLDRWSTEGDD